MFQYTPPSGGELLSSNLLFRYRLVSIHASEWRRTNYYGKEEENGSFNTRLRVEANYYYEIYSSRLSSFNTRLRVEANQ